MDDVSGRPYGIRHKLWSDARILQLWDDDSGVWEDRDILCDIGRAIDRLSIAEPKTATKHPERDHPTGGGPSPPNPPRDNGRRSSGQAPPSRITMTATISLLPSRSSRS